MSRAALLKAKSRAEVLKAQRIAIFFGSFFIFIT
jgi:hypothetical protein